MYYYFLPLLISRTNETYSCNEVKTVFQTVNSHGDSCCESAVTHTNVVKSLRESRIEHYEYLREHTNYIGRTFVTSFLPSANASYAFKLLRDVNRAILRDENCSVINDWWIDDNSRLYEIQFYDPCTIKNLNYTTYNFIEDFEHFRNLRTYFGGSFRPLFAVLSGEQNDPDRFSTLNVLNTYQKTDEEKIFFNKTFHGDASHVPYAAFLQNFDLLILQNDF